jgi:large subunit ribosomal protein L31e
MEKENNNHIEREYTIPLRKRCNIVPRYKKTNKAVKTVKEFLVRHMKIRDRDLNKIKIDKYLNEFLWMRGIKYPPSKVKVKAIKEGDIVKVELLELPNKIKYKKLREEKILEEGREKAKKKKEEKIKEEEKKETEKEETDKKESEEKEKEVAVIEQQEKIEKQESKKLKHETKVESPKEQKNKKVNYNRSSQGH